MLTRRLFLLGFLLSSDALICPIYNVFNNETNSIDVCPENSSLCSFWSSEKSSIRRCLGIYTFDEKTPRIRIRQLAIVDDWEERYVNRSECILDVDRTGQNLLCRCNSDNCTLKWRTAEKFVQPNSFRRSFVEQRDDRQWIWIFVVVVAVALIVVLLSIGFYRKSQREKDNRSFSTNLSNSEIDEFLSSKTNFDSIISQSKTNRIYRISIDDEKKELAVKIYHDQSSKNIYENEMEILRMIEYPTIVQLVGSGWHGPSPYLIFDYYPLGSLDHYLKENKSSLSTCFSFLRSLLQAIDYLHYEDLSANDYFTKHRIRKPILVHRDIKSSNILVKNTSPLTLVLTDFGLAKVLPSILTANDFIQIGTYRYMAPELLELAISHTSDALCKVDMYASALVMWEIIGQCDEYPHPFEYHLPYVEYVGHDEKNENRILDTLHRIVVNERKRPTFHRTMDMNSKFDEIFNLIEDCWKHEPESRLNARPALSRLERFFK